MQCALGVMTKGSAETSISRHLAADHSRLDILFDDACSLVGAGDFERAAATFVQFERGLAHHIAVEERFLFPAFDAHVHMPGPTTVMRHEHRQIEQLMTLASASLEARDAGMFGAEAAELAAVIHAHNLKEERILYPRTDAALDEEQRAQMVAALQLS